MRSAMRTSTPESGYTLLELVMVLVIAAVLTVPLLQIYRVYQIDQRNTETRSAVESAAGLITDFAAVGLTRYPCPADRSLAPGAANYGVEICNPAATRGLAAPTVGTPVSCTANGGFCWAAGANDINGDGDTVDADETLFIGGLPTATLGASGVVVSNKVNSDAFGSKLTYAVTRSQTSDTTFRYEGGVIDVEDEFGNNTAGMNNDAHYVVLSHGMDRRGAFGSNGTASPDACSAVARDGENCDGDSRFILGIGLYEQAGATYYDDVVIAVRSSSSALWEEVLDSAQRPTGNIISRNTMNVGIKTDTPNDGRLVVNGTIRTDNIVNAAEICDRSGNNCFNINAIVGNAAGGDRIKCDDARKVITAIRNKVAVCDFPTFAAPADKDCGAGWVHGIKTNGEVICWGGP